MIENGFYEYVAKLKITTAPKSTLSCLQTERRFLEIETIKQIMLEECSQMQL